MQSTYNSNTLLSAAKIGLIGGAATWHVCLVGMFETFAERQLVGEAITMGYVMLFLIAFFTSRAAARHTTCTRDALLTGTISGLVTGLLLLILAFLPTMVEMDVVFGYATLKLTELLTLSREASGGLLIPLVAGGVTGLAGGAITILQAEWRRTITTALLITLLVGLLRDVITVLFPVFINRILFTNSGLTVFGAIFVLLITGGMMQARYAYRTRQAASTLPQWITNVDDTWRQRISMGVLFFFLLIFPLWGEAFLSNAADFVGLYIIMGLGLNLVIGFAGMLDLGFVAFYAIGAYTMAILTSPDLGLFNLTFWQALPFSMIAAMIGGALLALPILKMRGDYLAIATLGFGEIIRILSVSDALKPYMGGAQGITLIARPNIGDFTLTDPQHFYYLILIGCMLAWFIASRLKTSKLGRSWMAVREDEDVAQAMGINRVTAKLLAFVIGAFLGGLSGGVFASMIGSVVPRSFDLLVSINVLSLIIVGGMGSLPGVVVGAIAMVGLPELLREFREYRMLVYGAVIVFMMLYRPQGLWPETVVAREFEDDPNDPNDPNDPDDQYDAPHKSAPATPSAGG